MQNRKYIQVVQTLSTKEFKQFSTYLHSPYFNKNKGVIRLFAFLKKYHPTYHHAQCNRKKAFAYVYPEKQYSEQLLRNLLSECYKLLEGFLAQQKFEQDTHSKNTYLLNAFHDRALDKFYQQKLKEANKFVNQSKYQDTTYYYRQYELELSTYTINVAGKGRLLESNLPKVLEYLDIHYLAEKLRYCCTLFNRQNIVHTTIEMPLLREILEYLSLQSFIHIPVIALWHRLLILLKEDRAADYLELKQLLTAKGHLLTKGEVRQIYTAAINYCNKKLTGGEGKYLQEIFDLYKNMLAQEVIITDGYIRPYMHFRNIVRVGVRVGELDWTEQFITDYGKMLPLSHRENIKHYCLAVLYFYKGAYQTTLNYLFGFEFQDFYNYIEHKTLLAKTYYELEELDALEALLNTFRIYLLRNESIVAHYRLTYQNFIKILTKLHKTKWEKRGDGKKLQKTIAALEPLADKEWLLSKVAEL